MLVDRYNSGVKQLKQLEFRNVNKDILYWFEALIAENNCKIERKEWKSKYNSYVIYDYEPFCSEGFEINILVSSSSYELLYFLNYLYKNKINTIEYLNSCAKI